MKMNLLFYAWSACALMFTACADDNSDIAPGAATLQTTLADGDWEVSSYIDSHPAPPLVEDAGTKQDKEDLNDLHNYSFSFKPKDMIIASAYGSTDPVGSWVASSHETTGEETLDMKYPYKPLDGLNGSWTVTERTENQVSLKLHDVVWGGDDQITFRKIAAGDGGQTPGGNN
jgi:hypothetical protein